MCWFLAFNKTFDAMKVHFQLKNISRFKDNDQDLSFNSKYSERKAQALNKILESYRVDRKHWNNDVWLTVSSLAASQKVEIDFNAIKPQVEADTNAVGVEQSFLFYGDYISLVKLLDKLEKTSNIGRISGVQIKTQSKDLTGSSMDICQLELNFQGIYF